MFSSIWHGVFFDPIYNSLVFFIDSLPKGDVGLAIIATVVLVKLILLPFSLKVARTQLIMREIEPKLKELKEKYKDQREEQARRMMELYRNAGVNPFSSILLLFLQIPIVIALYFAVSTGGGVSLPNINIDLLYSFVPKPETANMLFLGIVDIAGKSLLLALLAGITQYITGHLTLPKPEPRLADSKPDFKDDLARSMQLQMRYMMPILIFVVAYTISAAIALYFVVSNLMAIAQEVVVRRQGLKPAKK